MVVLVLIGSYFWTGRERPADSEPPVPDPPTAEMQGPVARAVTAARETVLAEPGSAEAWGDLGAVLDAHRLFDDAATCYRRARELQPNNFVWAYQLAIVEDWGGGNIDAVVPLFEEALAINDVYPPLYYRYADALVRQGRLDRAREIYVEGLRLDSNPAIHNPTFEALCRRGLGQVLLALDRPGEAIPALERAIAINPTDGNAHAALARAYYMADRPAEAREAAERSRRYPPVFGVPDPLRAGRQLGGLSAARRRRAEARCLRESDRRPRTPPRGVSDRSPARARPGSLLPRDRTAGAGGCAVDRGARDP
jgi:tetratricopeptide (TPR) repeat protein